MKPITPFNIDLLFCTDADVRGLTPVTVTDIYDGVSSNFHDNGLFSTEIFGRVGTPARESVFSYIRLNATVIHPAVFDVLKRLKSLYVDILYGRKYAIFDKETHDFIESDMLDGETGFAFFTKHIRDLQPDKRKSVKRNLYVDVFDKYKQQCLMDKCLVLPAMYRDISQDEDGHDVQDEINEYYRKLINVANSINLMASRSNDSIIDAQRRSLQNTMNDIYTYLMKMLDGKKGMIQAKWGSRRVAYGTRNVISSVETTARELGSITAPSVDDVQLGLYQTARAALPFTLNGIRERFTRHIFHDIALSTTLYHMKTFHPTQVDLATEVWDRWGTSEGLEKVIARFEEPRLRNKPIIIQNHYLALVFSKDNVFKIIMNGERIPDNPEIREHIHPMTYSEFLYLSNYKGWYNLRAINTRYPINNMYSIYPGKVYVKTTLTSYLKYELDENYQIIPDAIAREYPTLEPDAGWVNTAIPSFVRLKTLGADFKNYIIEIDDHIPSESVGLVIVPSS